MLADFQFSIQFMLREIRREACRIGVGRDENWNFATELDRPTLLRTDLSSSAPRGRARPAQGIALGPNDREEPSPEGAH